eukprot:343940-Chlamydomonas_euryale.AAC.13
MGALSVSGLAESISHMHNLQPFFSSMRIQAMYVCVREVSPPTPLSAMSHLMTATNLKMFQINGTQAAKLFRLLKQMEGGALPMGGAGSSSGLGLGAAGVVGGDGLELTLTSHAISSGGDETGGGGSGEDGGG